MKPLTLVLIGLLACGCSKSLWGRSLNVGIGVSAAADLISTERGLDRGAREANPLLQSEVRWLVKSAGVGAQIGLAAMLDAKGQQGWAHVIRLIAMAANIGVSIHNAGVQR